LAFRLGLRRKGPARAIHAATRDLTFRDRSGDGTLVVPSAISRSGDRMQPLTPSPKRALKNRKTLEQKALQPCGRSRHRLPALLPGIHPLSEGYWYCCTAAHLPTATRSTLLLPSL